MVCRLSLLLGGEPAGQYCLGESQGPAVGPESQDSGKELLKVCPAAWKECLALTWSSDHLFTVVTVIFADLPEGFHMLGNTMDGVTKLTKYETNIM